MIKRITDLEEMKRVVEVGDKIEVSDFNDSSSVKVGVITTYSSDLLYDNKFNILFEDGYGDDLGDSSLKELLNGYIEVWDTVVLIKEISDEISDFDLSIKSIFIIQTKSDFYHGKAILLNFNPSGSSTFLDKNGKLLIVRTSDIKYMRECKNNE